MKKITNLMILALVVTLGAVALAQDAPKAEVSADYSLVVYNPAKNLTGSRNLNGGGGAFVFNANKYFGIKGEFQGYGSTTATWTVPAGGAVPAGIYNSQANLFTYLFGPQVSFRAKKMRVFGEGLFGGAYTNGYANLFQAARYSSASASNNGFAMAMGGGLDINVSKSVAFRVAEVDYFLTRFQLPVLGTNNQSNFRYLAGVVFNIGGK